MSSGPNIKDGARVRKPRRVTLSKALNDRLDELQEAGKNISALTEQALRTELGMAATKENDDADG